MPETKPEPVRKEIGDTVVTKEATVTVKEVSRVLHIGAEANGKVTVYFETVGVLPDGREFPMSQKQTSRPVAAAAEALAIMEKLGRTWLAEDETPPPPPAEEPAEAAQSESARLDA